MSDYGSRVADKAISSVEKQLKSTYRQAAKELKEKLSEFLRKHEAKEKVMKQKLANGIISQQDYTNWQTGQLFMEKQWKDKIDQCTRVMFNANSEAAKIVHEKKLDVFAENYNYQAFQLTKKVGTDMGFNLYNTQSVAKLVKDKPDVLPKWKIDQKKDYVWNYKKVNNAVTQGIIQGEGIDKITDRLVQNLCTQNENKMRTFARTAITGAQNSGRMEQMHDAEDAGVKVKKRWVATLDDRTRDLHAELDGQEVDINEPFRVGGYEIDYPGDPSADPEMVYNCRCTMIQVYEGIDRHSVRRDDEDNEIEDMTYKEWKEAKENGTLNEENKLVTPPIGKQAEEGKRFAEIDNMSQEEQYEKVWDEIVKERSLEEYENSLTEEQAQELEKLLESNDKGLDKETYWSFLSDGLQQDDKVDKLILSTNDQEKDEKSALKILGKTKSEEEPYNSPTKDLWKGSKYESNHIAVQQSNSVNEVAESLGDSGVFSSAKGIKLDGIELSQAKEAAHTAMEMSEKYPWTKRKMNFVKSAKLAANTNAEFRKDTKVTYNSTKTKRWITINKLNYGSKNSANIVTQVGAYHPLGTGGIASTMRHEWGHSMVDVIASKLGRDHDTVAEEIVNRAFAKFGKPKTLETVKYHLSGYAAENDSELIAEAVCEYESSSTPRPLAKLVMQELLLFAKGAGLK